VTAFFVINSGAMYDVVPTIVVNCDKISGDFSLLLTLYFSQIGLLFLEKDTYPSDNSLLS